MVQLHNSWDALLKEEFKKPYYLALRSKLIEEYKNERVYPDMHDLYNALKLTPFEEVKAVILGQDPYFNPGQAHGLAFSVKKGVQLPPSLRNIFKELQEDLGCQTPAHGDLTQWAERGVLLLNASLSVRAGQPNSHVKLGWGVLTDRIIELLGEREEPLVFILWGQFAIKKAGKIRDHHLVLTSAHPSPLSATRGFFGSKPFSKTNAFLQQHHIEAIDWQID